MLDEADDSWCKEVAGRVCGLWGAQYRYNVPFVLLTLSVVDSLPESTDAVSKLNTTSFQLITK